MKIGVCQSLYQRAPEQEEVQAHRQWLMSQAEAGKLVGAGRKSTGDGGVVILRDDDVEALIAADPFVTLGVAKYEVTTFEPAFGELSK